MDEQYQAYLLRFIRSKEKNIWRVTLQNAHHGEIHHFSSEKDCFQFLMARLATNYSSSELSSHN